MLSSLLFSIQLPKSTQTCISFLAAAGQSRPSRAVKGLSLVKEANVPLPGGDFWICTPPTECSVCSPIFLHLLSHIYICSPIFFWYLIILPAVCFPSFFGNYFLCSLPVSNHCTYQKILYIHLLSTDFLQFLHC